MPKSPLLINANPMLPTTLLPEMRQADLGSSQHDLVLVKKSLFAAVYFFEFKYRMHTNFCVTYILQKPTE